MKKSLALAAVALLLVSAFAFAQSVSSISGFAYWTGSRWMNWKGQSPPVQLGTLLNSTTTGAANTPTVVTLTGAANQNVHLYRLGAFCSAGGTSAITIQDGATTILTQPAGAVGPGLVVFSWSTGLTFTTANNATLTLAACGVGQTGTFNTQADRF